MRPAKSYFPPEYVRGVGTFQDAGPLKNDPLLLALSETPALFPSGADFDFIVSLGTGEQVSTSPSTGDTRGIWKNGILPRLGRLFWERMRDIDARQIFQAHPGYFRLAPKFDGPEPMLDDVHSMHDLKEKVESDDSLSTMVDDIAWQLISSLFYFELDAIPQTCEGKFVGAGYIRCVLVKNDPAFHELFARLSCNQSEFLLDEGPITGSFLDRSYFGKDGNFRKRIDLQTLDRFSINLKRAGSAPCNISGSPFSMEKLITAQGLGVPFGRSDYRKRKRPGEYDSSPRKRQRVI